MSPIIAGGCGILFDYGVETVAGKEANMRIRKFKPTPEEAKRARIIDIIVMNVPSHAEMADSIVAMIEEAYLADFEAMFHASDDKAAFIKETLDFLTGSLNRLKLNFRRRVKH